MSLAKYLSAISASLGLLFLAGCSSNNDNEAIQLLWDGDFNSGKGWNLGPESVVSDGVCLMDVGTPAGNGFHEMFTQAVTVKPNTDYVLRANMKTSLHTLSEGVFFGVRFPDGRVFREKFLWLANECWTPLEVEFNSADQTSLTVFCGGWIDRPATYEADWVRLVEKNPEPAQCVTLESLLDEMVDRENFTRYPYPDYRCEQESSYDRRSVAPDQYGWFANGDWGGCVRLEVNEGRYERVLCDLEGPGAVTRLWTTTGDKRGTMRIYIDGNEEPEVVFEGFDGSRFPLNLNRGLAVKHPLYNEVMEYTGGSTLFLPIPYEKSIKITFEDPVVSEASSRYYHVNYRKYHEGTPVESFSMKKARALSGKIASVEDELLNHPAYEGSTTDSIRDYELPSGETLSLILPEGPNAIHTLRISSSATASLTVTADFDGRRTIDIPVEDLGLSGYLCRPMDSWWATTDSLGTVTCYYVMPYRNSAVISVTNNGTEAIPASIEAVMETYEWSDMSMYFHASYTERPGLTEYNTFFPAEEFVMADFHGRGIYMGDVLSINNYTNGWWGEGDEKIWTDADTFPSHFGTGSEDYYNASWGIDPFMSPFGGCSYKEDREGINYKGWTSMTRTRSLDSIPFSKRFLFHLEQESAFAGTADFNTTVLWYQE